MRLRFPMMRRLLSVLFVTAALWLVFTSATWAAVNPNWRYSYWGFGIYGWDYTQSTTFALRFWLAPGYTTSSSYYQLGSSLSTEFRTAVRNGAQQWNNQGSLFHYYELPLGGDPYDRTLGMTDLGSGGATGATILYYHWDPGSAKAVMDSWYTRFETNLYKYGWQWVVGAYSGGIDMQSTVTHELGHPLVFMDVQSDLSGEARPTMYFGAVTNTTFKRSPIAEETNALNALY